MASRTLPRNRRRPFEEDDELNEYFSRGEDELQARLVDEDAIQTTTSPDAVVEEVIESLGLQEEDQRGGHSCTHCREETRLERLSDLKPGTHIYLSGQKLKFNIPLKKEFTQVSAYTHHAVVKKVETVYSPYKASVRVFHFNKLDTFNYKIIEEVVEYDLKFDELYVVSYDDPHPPSEVIARAERCVAEHRSYNLLTYNCEHFATWCVSGTETSFQSLSVVSSLSEMLSGLIGKTADKVIRLILRAAYIGSDEIAAAAGFIKLTPAIAVGISAVLYLIYCIIKTIYLMKKDGICKRCLKRELTKLWAKFAVYLVTSGGSLAVILLIIPLLSQPVGWVVLGVLVVLSAGCVFAVPSLLKYFESPFQGDMIPANFISDIKPGNVVTFKYWGLPHDFLVTSVEELSSKRGDLAIIHYARETLFSTCIVQEEVLPIDLDKEEIKIHDYSGFPTYSETEAVERARMRIGETKHSSATNRSSHLCHWAKVDRGPRLASVLEEDCRIIAHANTDSERNDTLSSLLIEEFWIKIRDELQEGDVVRVQKLSGRAKGICTRIKKSFGHPKQCFKIDVVYLKARKVVEKTCNVDLRHDDIWVSRYHPAHCVSRNEILVNALSRVGRTYGRLKTPLDFVLDCVKR